MQPLKLKPQLQNHQQKPEPASTTRLTINPIFICFISAANGRVYGTPRVLVLKGISGVTFDTRYPFTIETIRRIF
jgi:hypothetical protein